MALTRNFKESIIRRMQADEAFAQALLEEATTLYQNGEPETARLIGCGALGDSISRVPIEAFQHAMNVPRSALYLADSDPQMPRYLPNDARSPFLGFCGAKWTTGGILLLAINPGGGGDTYQNRTPQDTELIPLIQEFRSTPSSQAPEAFERMCNSYRRQVQAWNLWRILAPTLDACGCTIEEVCYLNIFPYRTAKDAKPAQLALRNAWTFVTKPLLDALQPGRIIALGKKAGDIAAKLHVSPPPLHIVPRTIGDTYISHEAQAVLDQLRNATQVAKSHTKSQK